MILQIIAVYTVLLSGFKETRAHEARYRQFLFQNVQN